MLSRRRAPRRSGCGRPAVIVDAVTGQAFRSVPDLIADARRVVRLFSGRSSGIPRVTRRGPSRPVLGAQLMAPQRSGLNTKRGERTGTAKAASAAGQRHRSPARRGRPGRGGTDGTRPTRTDPSRARTATARGKGTWRPAQTTRAVLVSATSSIRSAQGAMTATLRQIQPATRTADATRRVAVAVRDFDAQAAT